MGVLLYGASQEIALEAGVGKDLKKRILPEEVPLIEGPKLTSVQSSLEITDFTCDGPWCGLDVIHSGMESKVPLQVQKDLESQGLYLFTGSDGSRGLGTRHALKEGTVIGPCAAILFSSLAKAVGFLKAGNGANGFLASSVVRLDGVRMHSQSCELFCILVGAARFCQDYVGIRRFPNVVLDFDPTKGCSPECLRLKVETPGGCGIAAGQPLLLKFGPGYNKEWQNPEVESQKRFKGALDVAMGLTGDSEAAKPEEKPNNPDDKPVTPEKPSKPVKPPTKPVDNKNAEVPIKPASEEKNGNTQVKPEPQKPDPETEKKVPYEEQAVAELKDPACRIFLRCSTPPTLHIASEDKANRKLGKNTVIKTWKDGAVHCLSCLCFFSKV